MARFVSDWRPLGETLRPLAPRDAVLASSNPALYYLTMGVRGVPNERMRPRRDEAMTAPTRY